MREEQTSTVPSQTIGETIEPVGLGDRGCRTACNPLVSRKLKDGLFAISLANLALIGAWFPVLSDADFGYYDKIPVKLATLLALVANMGWVAGVIWLLLQARGRWRNGFLES